MIHRGPFIQRRRVPILCSPATPTPPLELVASHANATPPVHWFDSFDEFGILHPDHNIGYPQALGLNNTTFQTNAIARTSDGYVMVSARGGGPFSQNHRYHLYGPTGTKIADSAADGDLTNLWRGNIIVDDDAFIIIGTKDEVFPANNFIRRVDKTGVITDALNLTLNGSVAYPHGLCRVDGNYYIGFVDFNADIVTYKIPTSLASDSLFSTTTSPSGFHTDISLCPTPAGGILIAEPWLGAYCYNSAATQLWFERGPFLYDAAEGANYPFGCRLGDDGLLYVGNSYDWFKWSKSKLFVFDPANGDLLDVYGKTAGAAIGAVKGGKIYVIQQQFNPEDIFLDVYTKINIATRAVESEFPLADSEYTNELQVNDSHGLVLADSGAFVAAPVTPTAPAISVIRPGAEAITGLLMNGTELTTGNWPLALPAGVQPTCIVHFNDGSFAVGCSDDAVRKYSVGGTLDWTYDDGGAMGTIAWILEAPFAAGLLIGAGIKIYAIESDATPIWEIDAATMNDAGINGEQLFVVGANSGVLFDWNDDAITSINPFTGEVQWSITQTGAPTVILKDTINGVTFAYPISADTWEVDSVSRNDGSSVGGNYPITIDGPVLALETDGSFLYVSVGPSTRASGTDLPARLIKYNQSFGTLLWTINLTTTINDDPGDAFVVGAVSIQTSIPWLIVVIEDAEEGTFEVRWYDYDDESLVRTFVLPNAGTEAALKVAAPTRREPYWIINDLGDPLAIPDITNKRADHGVVATRSGTIIVFGGRDNLGYLDSVEIYDIDTGAWSAGATMPNPRAAFAYAYNFSDEHIYFAGGENASGYPQSCYKYNIATDTWSTFSIGLPVARKYPGFALLSVGGTRYLHVAGGENAAGVQSVHHRCHLGTNIWSTATALPAALTKPTSVKHFQNLHLVGGYNSLGNWVNQHLQYAHTSGFTWTNNGALPHSEEYLHWTAVDLSGDSSSRQHHVLPSRRDGTIGSIVKGGDELHLSRVPNYYMKPVIKRPSRTVGEVSSFVRYPTVRLGGNIICVGGFNLWDSTYTTKVDTYAWHGYGTHSTQPP